MSETGSHLTIQQFKHLLHSRPLRAVSFHDLEGRVTNKVDQASAEILRYKYDAGGRLTNRWSAAKGNTYYAYDAVGNLTNVDYPAGTTDIRYQYDARNRVTNMVDAVGTTKYTYTACERPDRGRRNFRRGLSHCWSLRRHGGTQNRLELVPEGRRLGRR